METKSPNSPNTPPPPLMMSAAASSPENCTTIACNNNKKEKPIVIDVKKDYEDEADDEEEKAKLLDALLASLDTSSEQPSNVVAPVAATPVAVTPATVTGTIPSIKVLKLDPKLDTKQDAENTQDKQNKEASIVPESLRLMLGNPQLANVLQSCLGALNSNETSTSSNNNNKNSNDSNNNNLSSMLGMAQMVMNNLGSNPSLLGTALNLASKFMSNPPSDQCKEKVCEKSADTRPISPPPLPATETLTMPILKREEIHNVPSIVNLASSLTSETKGAKDEKENKAATDLKEGVNVFKIPINGRSTLCTLGRRLGIDDPTDKKHALPLAPPPHSQSQPIKNNEKGEVRAILNKFPLKVQKRMLMVLILLRESEKQLIDPQLETSEICEVQAFQEMFVRVENELNRIMVRERPWYFKLAPAVLSLCRLIGFDALRIEQGKCLAACLSCLGAAASYLTGPSNRTPQTFQPLHAMAAIELCCTIYKKQQQKQGTTCNILQEWTNEELAAIRSEMSRPWAVASLAPSAVAPAFAASATAIAPPCASTQNPIQSILARISSVVPNNAKSNQGNEKKELPSNPQVSSHSSTLQPAFWKTQAEAWKSHGIYWKAKAAEHEGALDQTHRRNLLLCMGVKQQAEELVEWKAQNQRLMKRLLKAEYAANHQREMTIYVNDLKERLVAKEKECQMLRQQVVFQFQRVQYLSQGLCNIHRLMNTNNVDVCTNTNNKDNDDDDDDDDDYEDDDDDEEKEQEEEEDEKEDDDDCPGLVSATETDQDSEEDDEVKKWMIQFIAAQKQQQQEQDEEMKQKKEQEKEKEQHKQKPTLPITLRRSRRLAGREPQQTKEKVKAKSQQPKVQPKLAAKPSFNALPPLAACQTTNRVDPSDKKSTCLTQNQDSAIKTKQIQSEPLQKCIALLKMLNSQTMNPSKMHDCNQGDDVDEDDDGFDLSACHEANE